MLEVCGEAAREGIPVFFYGSREDIIEQLALRLRQVFPKLLIAGSQPSLFRPLSVAERTALVNTIGASGAGILFVGLGCPRQEVFAYEIGQYLHIPILAVGAAFDYHSGEQMEPPLYLQRAGLQWLYRLVQEPRRLAKGSNSQRAVHLWFFIAVLSSEKYTTYSR